MRRDSEISSDHLIPIYTTNEKSQKYFVFQNEKRAGWVNVGELEGCVHFKIGKLMISILILDLYNSTKDNLSEFFFLADNRYMQIKKG